MKLGYIDYLNCYPFYHEMFKQLPFPDIEIIADYPKRLNQMLQSGQLDLSPISSAAYTDMQGDVWLLPDFCLSSVGYVGSVLLLSNSPIEELDNRNIGITNASQTSVALLKVVLEKFYSLAPSYHSTDPRPSLNNFDGVLVIGNDAMISYGRPAPYTYDLGDLWLRKTGHPVVFAVFAVQKKYAEQYMENLGKVVSSFRTSLALLDSDRETLIECAGKKYPDIIYDIGEYFSLLQFSFSDDLKAALSYYYDICTEAGLLKKVKQIEFLT